RLPLRQQRDPRELSERLLAHRLQRRTAKCSNRTYTINIVGRHAVFLLGVLAACVKPTLTHCPDVDCPSSEVCDGQGGCVVPAQLTICADQPDATLCDYVNSAGVSVSGSCLGGICLPVGCGNGILNAGEVCDDGNNISG